MEVKIIIKKKMFLFLFMQLSFNIFSQKDNIWISYYNSDSTLIGFKDSNGVEKIKPKFSNLTSANKFENIIIVNEIINNKSKEYYLNKNGESFKIDNVYKKEFIFDCENEGFIRFEDRLLGKVGLLDRNGNERIPALYNDLSKVHNGLLVARIDSMNFNLIDTTNSIIISNFKNFDNLNLYTFIKTNQKNKKNNFQYFYDLKNNLCGFENFEIEFKNWFLNYCQNFNIKTLQNDRIKTVNFEIKNERKFIEKSNFNLKNFRKLNTILKNILKAHNEIIVTRDGINEFIYNKPEYQSFFDNCGNSKNWLNPTFIVVINKYNKQNLIEFIKTNNGYELLSITDRNLKLKNR